jgi:predicted metalloendopeptidase
MQHDIHIRNEQGQWVFYRTVPSDRALARWFRKLDKQRVQAIAEPRIADTSASAKGLDL